LLFWPAPVAFGLRVVLIRECPIWSHEKMVTNKIVPPFLEVYTYSIASVCHAFKCLQWCIKQ
jgi:hypothetical protein